MLSPAGHTSSSVCLQTVTISRAVFVYGLSGPVEKNEKTLAPLAFLSVATSKIVKIATPLPLYLILLVWMRLTSDRKVSRF